MPALMMRWQIMLRDEEHVLRASLHCTRRETGGYQYPDTSRMCLHSGERYGAGCAAAPSRYEDLSE